MKIDQTLNSLESLALSMTNLVPTAKKVILADAEIYCRDLRNASYRYQHGRHIRLKIIELEESFHQLSKVRTKNLHTDSEFVAEIQAALAKLRSSLCFGQPADRS
jgi:methyl coenzyme M reductase subunit C-like uncharacterized protein (methanogenesis marker protein 7)